MVRSYLLDSLLHPSFPSRERASVVEQLEPAAPSPAVAAPLARLNGHPSGTLQSSEEGEVDLVSSRAVPSRADYWTVTSAAVGDWVYLQDPLGRYLATDSTIEAEGHGSWRWGGRAQLVRMSVQKTVDCRWWLTVITFGGTYVVLRNAQGLIVQKTQSLLGGPAPPVECREWQATFYAILPLRLDTAMPSYPRRWRGCHRNFSRALDLSDELSSITVRCVVVGMHRAEKLLTAMPGSWISLTAPPDPDALPDISSGAEWSMIRTATPGVVYLRSHSGLYLTADYVEVLDVDVLMAAKCMASRWRVMPCEDEEATTVMLQHCGTSEYLRASAHWLWPSTRWICMTSRHTRASRFTLLSV